MPPIVDLTDNIEQMAANENSKKQHIRFIINPISGNNKNSNVAELIEKTIDKTKYSCDFRNTEYTKHATQLAQDAVNENIDIVVAVGGDGTVNEVSKALIGTNVRFGIIPSGSGNGLGRFLKIPLKVEKAIKIINNSRQFSMDAIQINDEYSVNVAGLGFDAHISHLFANFGQRGFKSYLKLILREYPKYKPQKYNLKIDGQLFEKEAFLISFANSSQFGNNAHIAPLAEINDGLIDICVLKQFPAWRSLFISILLYSRGLTKSKYYEVKKAKEIEIINQSQLWAHIDGDPIVFNENVKIKILPESLRVIIP